MFFPLGFMFGGGLFTKLCPTLVTPWTIARQASLSMGFSKQEYWSGLPFPSPGSLPDPGIKPAAPSLWVLVCTWTRTKTPAFLGLQLQRADQGTSQPL